MALNRTAWGTTITEVSTTALEDLGALREFKHSTYGWGIWRYIKNGSASSLTQGLGAMQENGTSFFEAELSGAGTDQPRMLGIADHTIAAGSYGWVLASGRCQVKAAAAGITADTAIEASASGLFEVLSGATATVGFAHETQVSGVLADATVRFL